jgi:vacuolar-type H+-ATPase subunit E/Vma4
MGEPYILVMSLSDKEKYGERIKTEAALSDELKNKRIVISENASHSGGGLIVKYGSIEVNATVDAIINTARQGLESEVYKALFN